MKLSEILQAEADDAGGHGETFGREHRSDLEHYAALARALEERVAELEVGVQSERENIWAHDELLQAANARAEVAEAEVARQIKLAMGYADERDALRAKMEKVRAEVDKFLRWPKYTNPTAHKVASVFERIIDGEGDNES